MSEEQLEQKREEERAKKKAEQEYANERLADRAINAGIRKAKKTGLGIAKKLALAAARPYIFAGILVLLVACSAVGILLIISRQLGLEDFDWVEQCRELERSVDADCAKALLESSDGRIINPNGARGTLTEPNRN